MNAPGVIPAGEFQPSRSAGCWRTLCAYLFAPLVAPVLYASLAATIRPPGEGPTWLNAFAMYAFIGALDSYLVSWTYGTVVFLVLRALHRESTWLYALCGAVPAGAFMLLVSRGQSEIGKMLQASLAFGALGASVSTAFALIRGKSRRIPSAKISVTLPVN